ncbi:hypothetical protein ASO19_08990, partial [Parasaccharibacter apium]
DIESFKPDRATFLGLLKQQKIFAVLHMIADGSVSRDHPHIAKLALPRIAEAPICFESILVANMARAVPGKNEDPRRVSRR